MEPNFSVAIIKLEHDGKIFRLSEVPRTLSDLQAAFKKYFPENFLESSQKFIEILCQTNSKNPHVFDFTDEKKYGGLLADIQESKSKAIKFILRIEGDKNPDETKQSITRSSSNEEKETLDSEVKVCLCFQCSQNLSYAIEGMMACENCSRTSIKKIPKSLSPPSIEASHQSFFRKKSHTCTFGKENRPKLDSPLCLPRRHKAAGPDYQAKIICLDEKQFTFHNLKTNENYELRIKFFNSGNKKWPKNMRFRCVSGIFEEKEVEVGELEMQEVSEVKMNLKAPELCGRYHLAWRLCYLYAGKIFYFGPRVVNEIYVSDI